MTRLLAELHNVVVNDVRVQRNTARFTINAKGQEYNFQLRGFTPTGIDRIAGRHDELLVRKEDGLLAFGLTFTAGERWVSIGAESVHTDLPLNET
jgi:hypothetical protein